MATELHRLLVISCSGNKKKTKVKHLNESITESTRLEKALEIRNPFGKQSILAGIRLPGFKKYGIFVQLIIILALKFLLAGDIRPHVSYYNNGTWRVLLEVFY